MPADRNPAPTAGPIASRAGHLRATLAVTSVVMVGATIIGGLIAGSDGALGAFLGVAVVAGSYLLSDLAVAWADSVSPKLVLSVGLGTYLFKFSLLGLALLAVPKGGWAGLRPMAVGMVVMIVGWLTAQIWWTVRRGTPPADPSHA